MKDIRQEIEKIFSEEIKLESSIEDKDAFGRADSLTYTYVEWGNAVSKIQSLITESNKEVLERFVEYAKQTFSNSTVQGTENADVDYAMDMTVTQMLPDMLDALLVQFLTPESGQGEKGQ